MLVNNAICTSIILNSHIASPQSFNAWKFSDETCEGLTLCDIIIFFFFFAIFVSL